MRFEDSEINGTSTILWLIATIICFLCLTSTIYTIFRAYQLWTLIDEIERSIVDLVDETMQILIPIEICKFICHPNIGAANFHMNPSVTSVVSRKKENRYPEDVTYPPSDIEGMYDFFGDEEARMSKTMQLSVVSIIDENDKKGNEKPNPPEQNKNAKSRKTVTPKSTTGQKKSERSTDSEIPQKKEGSKKSEGKSPAVALTKTKSESNVPIKPVKSTPAIGMNEYADIKKKQSVPALVAKKSDVDVKLQESKTNGKETKSESVENRTGN